MATPREAELEAELAAARKREADMQQRMEALEAQVQSLSRGQSRSASPFASMRPGIPPPPGGGPTAMMPRAGSRPMSPRQIAPRAMSPRRAPSPGRTAAFGSTAGTRRSGPPAVFHASMRGGPLSEPMPQVGLTPRERADPHSAIRGPSLLTRDKYGAKKSEWERFKLGGKHGSLMEDDNPFNDPFKYRQFKGLAFPPSDYIGPDDPRETDNLATLNPNALRLSFCYGYQGRRSRNNLFYNADHRVVYHSAALGIVYDKDTHVQLHFMGHDDDITALDIHPDKVRVVTGQIGKDPKVMIWSSRPPKGTNSLPCLCVISGDHRRGIIGVGVASAHDLTRHDTRHDTTRHDPTRV